MLLTISTTHRPATDLGYLLHKNPENVHEAELAFGTTHMFYPEASDERCTFALLLDIDPIGLVRRRQKHADRTLEHYVNDRPYAASSFLSVAMARTLRTALSGKSNERPELAETAIPLTATITPLPCRGSATLVDELFAPLGYDVTVETTQLDAHFPDWGESPYVHLTLKATCRLKDLLNHIYVLVPVLDRRKHYYVSRDELEKLLAKGEGWLANHPAKELIAKRYLKYRGSLAAEAMARLVAEEDTADALDDAPKDAIEEALEQPLRLHDMRLDRVAEVLKEAKARRVVDLGCGEGKLLRRLLADKSFDEIVGIDVSIVSLERAAERLRLERMSERQRKRIRLLQGALTYRDRRIEGYDAVALVEVIEHLEPDRLGAMERAVFEFAHPRLVVITTPNREYNAKFDGMAEGKLRHPDHRFEWTRDEFAAWAKPVAERYGYELRFEALGEEDGELGAPSQMAMFERA
ncbi:MAG: 3' terminal RNA ribose 2'-O-methyltransferase Hen1 [Hyphomicrobiaceae bacterium]